MHRAAATQNETFAPAEGHAALRLLPLLDARLPLPLFIFAALFLTMGGNAALFFAPGLLVTGTPAEILARIADANGVFQGGLAGALKDGALPEQALLFAAANLTDSPGRAVLVARAIAAGIIALPLAAAIGQRFAILPGLALFMVPLAALLAGGTDIIAMAAAFYVFIVALAVPARTGQGRQAEGLCAAVFLMVLYLSSVPLFVAALLALTITPFLRGRDGLAFAVTAYAGFAIAAVILELFILTSLPELPGYLPSRLESTGWQPTSGAPSLVSLVCTLIILAGFAVLPRRALGRQVLAFGFLTAAGAASFFADTDLTPFALIAVFLGLSSPAFRRTESAAGFRLLALLLALFSAGLSVFPASQTLTAQLKRPVLAEMSDYGFSFEEDPVLARLVLARRVDHALTGRELSLTAADQALLLSEGARLQAQMNVEGKRARLVAMDSGAPASYLIVPRLPIDPLTEKARLHSQGLLYSEYEKLPATEQPSAAYEIWRQRD